MCSLSAASSVLREIFGLRPGDIPEPYILLSVVGCSCAVPVALHCSCK